MNTHNLTCPLLVYCHCLPGVVCGFDCFKIGAAYLAWHQELLLPLMLMSSGFTSQTKSVIFVDVERHHRWWRLVCSWLAFWPLLWCYVTPKRCLVCWAVAVSSGCPCGRRFRVPRCRFSFVPAAIVQANRTAQILIWFIPVAFTFYCLSTLSCCPCILCFVSVWRMPNLSLCNWKWIYLRAQIQ